MNIFWFQSQEALESYVRGDNFLLKFEKNLLNINELLLSQLILINIDC